ncbi:MAG: ROK family protein, partial [Planctomycetia bacterium]|nr:ROK family protein [Planctomycetia bacterium]
MKILVIDVGGTNIKLKLSDRPEIRKTPSGPMLTAAQLVAEVKAATADWPFDVISVGFPGPVSGGKIVQEPVNLGPGWVGFDFGEALGKPTRLINDAAMQALGSYEGGRMLFLGLGTGLGNCLIYDNVIAPMELGHLPYRKGRTFEMYVGQAGLRRMGKRKWQSAVFDVVARLRAALQPDYIVLGGGNVKKLDELPPHCRMGNNDNA